MQTQIRFGDYQAAQNLMNRAQSAVNRVGTSVNTVYGNYGNASKSSVSSRLGEIQDALQAQNALLNQIVTDMYTKRS